MLQAPFSDSNISFYSQPLTNFRSVGPRTHILLQKLFKKTTQVTVFDLLKHMPTAVIDRRYMPKICEAKAQTIATLKVTIISHIPPKRRGLPYRVICQDETDTLQLVFFQGHKSYIQQNLPAHEQRIISGKIDIFQGKKQITHPDYICKLSEQDSIPKIEPVYPLTSGLHHKLVMRLFSYILPSMTEIEEWIDQELLTKKQWPSFKRALQAIHKPYDVNPDISLKKSRERLAFDECLANQLALQLVRKFHRHKQKAPLHFIGQKKNNFISKLPFQLTLSQEKVLCEIEGDLKAPFQMTRLLQGDVGSGKTVVAFASALDAIEAGCQVVLVAPIDLLARQHFEKAKTFFSEVQDDVRIICLTGREKGKKRDSLYQEIETGEANLIIGTHAVFQEKVNYKNLGYVIIDEQHRFGVEQRIQLMQKGRTPNLLVMTATPIPRTLQMTQYGDMDTSYLQQKPAGRQKISTHLIDIQQIENIVDRLKKLFEKKTKVYWVCPLIEESDKMIKTAAEERFRYLQHHFKNRVGLVHGKMKASEKDAVMDCFTGQDNENSIDILVSTTVIEVGMDVKEATVMVIEHAEQFGLAQLHQLRGRVGRGDQASYCLLVYKQPLSQVAKKRLQIMKASEDGFFIAEEDLKLRGGGDLLGTQQSGFLDLAFFDFDEHQRLIPLAKKHAQMTIEKDPHFSGSHAQTLKKLLALFEKKQAIKYLGSG